MNHMDKIVERFIKVNQKLKRWKRGVSALAAVVVFVTTYALILPALTLDVNTASTQSGMSFAESASKQEGSNSASGADDSGDQSDSVKTSSPDSQNAPQSNEDSQGDAEGNTYNEESGANGTHEDADSGEETDHSEAGTTGANDVTENENASTGASAMEDSENSESSENAENSATNATAENTEIAATEMTAEEDQTIPVAGQLTYTYIDEDFEQGRDDHNDGYTVTVSYSENAGIPASAELHVREVEEDSDEYLQLLGRAWNKVNEKYLEREKANSEASEEAGGDANGADDTPLYVKNFLQAKFFDITFMYNGEKIEPKAPVQVDIHLLNGLHNAEDAEMTVLHFNEGDSANKGGATQQEGPVKKKKLLNNKLSGNRSAESTSIESIENVQTTGSDEKITRLTFEQDSFSIDGLITAVEANKKERTPVSLQAASSDDEIEPPKADKWKTDNEDGTYKIHLSVTGSSSSSDEVKKSNIIIIMDESSSMRYGQLTKVGSASNGTPNFTPDPNVQYYYPESRGSQGGINGSALTLSDGKLYTVEGMFIQRLEPYTGDVYTFKNRLNYEQEALGGLVHSLLSNNKDGQTSDGTSLKDVVEIAVLGFNSRAWVKSDWSTSETAIMGAINEDETGNETHWWDALNLARDLASSKRAQQPDEDTYVLFLTDGRPLEIVLNPFNPTPEQYYNKCVPSVQNLMNLGSYIHLYNIYTYGALIDQDNGANNPGDNNGRYPEKQRLQDLTGVAQGIGDASYHDANTVQDLIDTFSQILSVITKTIAYGRVSLTDGLTADTATSALINGTVDGMSYKVSGAMNYTVTATGDDANPTVVFHIDGKDYETTEKKTGVDGKPYYEVTVDGTVYKMALADFQNNRVNWDLGGVGVLENGCTYEVSFDMWPNQEAYDYLADLNNGKETWGADTPVTDKDGNIIYYAGGADGHPDVVKMPDGTFANKTNEDQSVTYSIVKTQTGQAEPEYKGPYEETLPHPEPMVLTDRKIQVQKVWNDSLDESQLDELVDEGFSAKLTLQKDSADYLTGLVISPVQEGGKTQRTWPETDAQGNVVKHDISAGLMVSEDKAKASGLYAVISKDSDKYPQVELSGTTYFILDEGHDYQFAEAEQDKHFELEKKVFHPMLVDGKLRDVAITKDSDRITGITSISELPVSEDKDATTLTATNNLKGGINIQKKVYDADDNEMLVSDSKFKVRVTLQTAEGAPYEDWDYRIYYGPNNPDGTWNEDAGNYGASGHVYGEAGNGGIIEKELYIGDVLRVVNVPNGVTYSVVETEYDEDVYSIGANYTFDLATGGSTRSFTTNEDGISYLISVDHMDDYKVDQDQTVKSNSASQAIVVNKIAAAKVKLLKLGNTATPLHGVKFKIYRDEACTQQVTKDAVGKAFPGIDKDGAITTDNDGYASLGTLVGTYYINEVATQDGYMKLSEPIKITVTKDGDQMKVTATCKEEGIIFDTPGWISKDDAGVWTIKINNPAGAELPAAGGPGTVMLYLMGMIMVMSAAVVLFISQKSVRSK